MPLLEYWSCPNGHIVQRQYMPEFGTICNVIGCKGERKKHLADVSEEAKAADEFISVVFKSEEPRLHWVLLTVDAEKLIESEIND